MILNMVLTCFKLVDFGHGWNQGSRREAASPKAMLQHLFSATSPRKNGQRPSLPRLLVIRAPTNGLPVDSGFQTKIV